MLVKMQRNRSSPTRLLGIRMVQALWQRVYKDLYLNVHSSFVCDILKLETIQMFISGLTHTQIVVYTSGVLLSNKNKLWIHAAI